MESLDRNAINTVGAVLGIFAAMVAVVIAALNIYSYIDRKFEDVDKKYIRVEPAELTKIIADYQKKLAKLTTDNESKVLEIKNKYNKSIDQIKTSNSSLISEEKTNLIKFTQSENRRFEALYKDKKKDLGDIEIEMKGILFAMQSINEKTKEERDKIFNNYLNKNIGVKFEEYLDKNLNKKIDKYLSLIFESNIESYINKKTKEQIVTEIVNGSKTVNLGNGKEISYYKTIDNHVYLNGSIYTDLSRNKDITLFTLKDGYRPERDIDITDLSIKYFAGKPRINLTIKSNGDVVINDQECCDVKTIVFNNIRIK